MSSALESTPEERMLLELQQAYALKVAGGGVLVALSSVTIFVGAILFTLVMGVLSWFWFDSAWFLLWFLLYAAGVGFLFYREIKHNSSPFDELAASGQPPIDLDVDEYLETPAPSKLARYTNAIQWAPRSFLLGIATMQRKDSLRFLGLLHRAARMMVFLYADKDPVALPKLIEPGESPSRFREALDWLDTNDFVGRSSDGKRVWVSTKMRTKLAEDGFSL